MPPILIGNFVTVDPPVHLRSIEVLETTPKRQVVGSVDNIDRVNLQSTSLLQMSDKRSPIEPAWFGNRQQSLA